MNVRIEGTIDLDQVLSLRFGDALKVDLPKWAENKLCDVFWDGDMQIRLIDTFNITDNGIYDFTLEGDVTEEGFTLTAGTLGPGLPLDPEWLAEELGLT